MVGVYFCKVSDSSATVVTLQLANEEIAIFIDHVQAPAQALRD
jgi:hypothetical protein